jgi:hypothetical protein
MLRIKPLSLSYSPSSWVILNVDKTLQFLKNWNYLCNAGTLAEEMNLLHLTFITLSTSRFTIKWTDLGKTMPITQLEGRILFFFKGYIQEIIKDNLFF